MKFIAEKLSALWELQNLFKERAKRADIEVCRAVLAKVPDNPVDDFQKINYNKLRIAANPPYNYNPTTQKVDYA